ncbi:MAG: hypothetical protein HYZ81_24705 [Nitrospinae bacterium]|nr:hypothetical protein [Nitrospinota bacterium]
MIRAWVRAGRRAQWQAPMAVLAAALLFNLGQGVLRPTLPLYLKQVFAANYRMVTRCISLPRFSWQRRL